MLGSAYAAADGDPRTAWTAPQRVVQHRTRAQPDAETARSPTEVAALRLTPSSSALPAHPTPCRRRPRRRPAGSRGSTADAGAQTLASATDGHRHGEAVHPRLGRRHRPHRTGFRPAQTAGSGRGDRAGPAGQPIAAADAARNRTRAITLPCGKGPIIAVAGQFVQTSVDTTVGALLDGDPIAATPCRPAPDRPAGGPTGAAGQPRRGVRRRRRPACRARWAANCPPPQPLPSRPVAWSADHREVDVPASQASRILVVPESINPGWTARTADGTALTPVTVNGWQQGWVRARGHVRHRHVGVRVQRRLPRRILRRPRAAADAGAAGVRARAAPAAAGATRRGRGNPARSPRGLAIVAAGGVIAGIAGIVVFCAALGVGHLLRNRAELREAVAVGTSAGGLILAGAVLRQNPWRSVDGYVGHSWGVQLLALISVGALAASAGTAQLARLASASAATQYRARSDRHRRSRRDADARARVRAVPRDHAQLSRGLGRRGQTRGRRRSPGSTSSSPAAWTPSSTSP